MTEINTIFVVIHKTIKVKLLLRRKSIKIIGMRASLSVYLICFMVIHLGFQNYFLVVLNW